MTNRLVDPLLLERPVALEWPGANERSFAPAGARTGKRRPAGVWALLAALAAALVLVPAALADDDDDDDGGPATPTTVTFGSSPEWGGQHVCLNDANPAACPPDATRYGYPGPGWFAGPRLHGSNWLWLSGVTGATTGAELDTATFSRTFELNGMPTSGEICLAADDYADVTVNGTFVGSVGSITNPAQSTVAQNTFTCFDITAHLQSGSNSVVVFGQNGPGFFAACMNCRYSQHPAGVAFYGQLTFVPDGDDDDDDGDDDDDDGDDDGGDDG
jgi:hypothetical protein